jgi:RimJ/RimL family protein N-acetyltransferase
MLEAAERWQQAENAVLFALVPADTGRAAGWASYMRIKPAHGVIEVGNVLFSPVLKQTRAATEAMYLMARHVFEDLGYRRYEWKCNGQNEPSRRAALRFGFRFEGIFRQHMVTKDHNRDTAWFSMLDCEWPARKRAFEAWLDPGNFDGDGRQKHSLTEIAGA